MKVRFVYAKTNIDIVLSETSDNINKISIEELKKIHSNWKDRLDKNKQADLIDTLVDIFDSKDIEYYIDEPDLILK